MPLLHAKTLGQGKPFLILHGFLGMSDNWKTLGGKFAEKGFEVHLIDHREDVSHRSVLAELAADDIPLRNRHVQALEDRSCDPLLDSMSNLGYVCDDLVVSVLDDRIVVPLHSCFRVCFC